jgi:hypothetical protein
MRRLPPQQIEKNLSDLVPNHIKLSFFFVVHAPGK